jgi:hypothetical protein
VFSITAHACTGKCIPSTMKCGAVHDDTALHDRSSHQLNQVNQKPVRVPRGQDATRKGAQTCLLYDSCKDDRWCHTLIHAVRTHIHIPRPKRGQTVVCESGHACERSTYTPWGRAPATVGENRPLGAACVVGGSPRAHCLHRDGPSPLFTLI